MMKEIEELPSSWDQSFDFFLKFMINYGQAFQEMENSIDSQHELMEELSLAAKIQQSLFPMIEKLDLPSSLDIGVVRRAARKVTGDFYNMYGYPQGLKFAVADVSGKSMPAAIFMSMIKFAMDSLIEQYHRPHVALASLNRFICSYSDPAMFVIMFWGEFNTGKNRFYYSCAGHEPGLLYKAKQKRFYSIIYGWCDRKSR